MYRMYVLKCEGNGRVPLKKHSYDHIFNFEYNSAFQHPKKDLCDLCEEIKANKANETQIDEDKTENMKNTQVTKWPQERKDKMIVILTH